MSRKRANGEGSIFKRSDGRWAATISVDRGQRKTFYGPTRQDVARKLNNALKTRQDGLPLVSERQTVSQYLERWLASVEPSIRPRTHRRYEQYVRVHAIPEIGRIPLAKLGPHHLQQLYAKRIESGASATTVAHLHAVMHRALKQAAQWGLTARNVATLVNPPRIRKQEMNALSPEQTRTLLEAASAEGLKALYVLAVTTGTRQGELLALRWRDVDLDGSTLRVVATLQRTPDGFTFSEPKTARSRRQVALTSTAVEALRQHRTAQAEQRLQATAWEDNDLVFANEVGRPIEATNLVRRSFHPLLTKAGLPRIRFHDLRHTSATLMLSQGVHPKIVSEMLGHSNIAITLDLYSHVTPTMQEQATAAMDAILTA